MNSDALNFKYGRCYTDFKNANGKSNGDFIRTPYCLLEDKKGFHKIIDTVFHTPKGNKYILVQMRIYYLLIAMVLSFVLV